MARPLYKNLTVQVLTAITVGAALGAAFPEAGKSLKPLGEAFIKLVAMVVAPVVFLTIVVGIAGMRDLRKAGRVGLKAMAYFLTFTTLALVIGMVVANVFHPGKGFQASQAVKQQQREAKEAAEKAAEQKREGVAEQSKPATAPTTAAAAAAPSTTPAAVDPKAKPAEPPKDAVAEAKKKAAEQKEAGTTGFLLNIIPKTFVGAFVGGEMLQVLLVALLFGVALAGLGDRGAAVLDILERLSEVMFRIVALLMRVAPLGALGAMAYTIGAHGPEVLGSLLGLMLCVYLTMAAFIFVVLWAVCRVAGFSLFGYLKFIKDEILLVLGTSSSEPALPRMIEKLELMGCGRPVVGLVIPAGYSFNLDGTSIYLSMAALFIAQALGVELTFAEQVSLLGVLVLTSKGAAAITGGGFITLAATLDTVRPELVPGLAIILGVDRFMSEARAITNLIGNGVATIVVSKWEGAFDEARYAAAMAGHPLALGSPSPEVSVDLAREPAAGMER